MKFAYITNSRWRAAAILEIENSQQIETKFCRNMQIAIVKSAENNNLPRCIYITIAKRHGSVC